MTTHNHASDIGITHTRVVGTIAAMSIHERLQQARRAAGYDSARSAAIRHEWNVNTYKAHEAGLNGIKPATAVDYANAYGTKASWILTGEGDPPKALARPPQSRESLPPGNASQPMRPPPMGARDLPVLGLAIGGDEGKFQFNGEAVAYENRPAELVGVTNSYAVYVSGESMSPRYEPGETVWVHPSRPPRRGDDVVVQLKPAVASDPPEGYIKRFVAWTPGALVLSQFNPQGEIEFDRPLVLSVHVIIGSLKA